ncbi:MAG: heterodisulfide reductase-related iron-sulfur binding cluster [Desulfobacteraceae bacterium]|jgi:glycerol-3-phosphate dehydrogenase subunit C|nr:heterodisulfide reductase-related iron-sulfur binding cluster [Desulfobacteraceae bacterium]
MEKCSPDKKARKVVDECADCDVCRFLMDSDCLMFPELYRLYDREIETGVKISSEELRHLVDLCNFCALCPCPPVRANLIEAKTSFIDRDGLKFGVRTLEDVERMARLCGTFPQLANRLLRGKASGGLVKKAAGIHPARQIPSFPEQSFPQWAKNQNLNTRPNKTETRKIAYFAGCTANYLFPEVPRAAVEVFQHNGLEVIYPEQKCCGMPSMLEGDRGLTLEFVRHNIDMLADTVAAGYDIVCSCPTCGFMLRNVLKENAYYSSQYQSSVGAGDTHLKIPAAGASANPGGKQFNVLNRSMFQDILKDEGYFAAIDPMKRILVAENTYDLGEFLMDLHRAGELNTNFGELSGPMVYFPPCHLREQNIGRPYQELLNLLPDANMEAVDGSLYCCGMAGIMGFKKDFYETSIHLGRRLMDKINRLGPQLLITDCLSCRLQFNQLLPYKVLHPVEILKEAY